MRKYLLLTAVLVGFATSATAADDDAQAIIERAIKAFGPEKLATDQSGQVKSKGTLDIMGGIAMTQEVTYLLPDKFREVMEMDIMGQKVTVTTVYNGKDAWINANGQQIKLDDKMVAEMKEAAHLFEMSRLLKLKMKDAYTLSTLGEAKVNDQPADGVKIATKGYRDVNMYFDKKTGLLAKVERTALDFMTQQEVNEERIILEYQEVEGRKVPKRVLVLRNGKKLLEAETIEFKSNPRVEASDFDKP